LVQAQRDKSDDVVKTDAEHWVTVTHSMIESAYGEGEAALFLDDSGYIFYSEGTEKAKYRNWIDGRMRRMGELMTRADSLSVRKEFDTKQFERPAS